MKGNSSIEWTDANGNPVRGCSKVSPVCLYCYGETLAEQSRGVTGFGLLLRLVHEKLLSLYAGVRQRWSSLTR